MAINGPEFSKEGTTAQVCGQRKSPRRLQNGLSCPNIGDQRPHHSVAKHSHIAGQLSRDAPAPFVVMSTRSDSI